MEEDLNEWRELERVKAIIEKAQRTKEDVTSALVSHMVSKSLIEKITGELPVLEKRTRNDKSDNIREWALTKLGKEFGTTEISKSLDCSYDKALQVIKDNPDYFTRSRRGYYVIHDGVAEREEARQEA